MGLRRIPKNEVARATQKVREYITAMEMLLNAKHDPLTGLYKRYSLNEAKTVYWDAKGVLKKIVMDELQVMQVQRGAGKSFAADLWQEKLKEQMERSMGLASHIISDEFHRGAGDSIVINRRTTK